MPVASSQSQDAREQRGIVLVLSLLILAVVTAIGIGVSTIIVREVRLSATARTGTLAYFLAESGVERALYTVRSFRQDPNACLDSGASCTIPTIKAQTGSGFPSGGTYSLSATASTTGAFTTTLAQDRSAQIDIFNVDDSLNVGNVFNVKSIHIDALGNGSEWLELSWTGWDKNANFSTQPRTKFFAHTDLTGGALNVDLLPLDGLTAPTAGFRLRLKALYADVANLTVTAYSDFGGSAGSGLKVSLPARVIVKSVGDSSGVKQALVADLPWKIPIGGLFDYVLYSEDTLAKEIATGAPVFSSGAIQVEDAVPPTVSSCVGCSAGAASPCNPTGSSCKKDCGWKATSCGGATTCGYSGGVGSCSVGNCNNKNFTIPIPDSIGAGTQYYVSVKAKYTVANGEHMNLVVDNTAPNPTQTLTLFDQSAIADGSGNAVCTIPQTFELKAVSGRTMQFVVPASYQYASTAVDVDWYQISTFKLFGDCVTTSNGSGTACVSPCGNGVIDPGEQCDPGPPPDLAGENCNTQAFLCGTLTCTATCTFNTSACSDSPSVCCPPAGCTGGQTCCPGVPLGICRIAGCPV